MTQSTFRLRGAKSSLVILETLVLVPFGICLAAAFRQPGMWIACALLLAAGIFIFLWFESIVIEVKDGQLRYRSLFGGTKLLSMDEIKETRLEVGIQKYRDRFRPPYRLVVVPRSHVGVAPFDINLRIFSRRDIENLVALLSGGQASHSHH